MAVNRLPWTTASPSTRWARAASRRSAHADGKVRCSAQTRRPARWTRCRPRQTPAICTSGICPCDRRCRLPARQLAARGSSARLSPMPVRCGLDGYADRPGLAPEGGYGTRRNGLPAAADRADCSLHSRPRGAQAGEHPAGGAWTPARRLVNGNAHPGADRHRRRDLAAPARRHYHRAGLGSSRRSSRYPARQRGARRLTLPRSVKLAAGASPPRH
jgi:hypothetical protein